MSTTKTEAPAVAAARGFGDQTKTNTDDCARQDAERKALSTLQARFALRGFELTQVGGGALTAHRWGLTRELANFGQAEQFLEQIGGTQ